MFIISKTRKILVQKHEEEAVKDCCLVKWNTEKLSMVLLIFGYIYTKLFAYKNKTKQLTEKICLVIDLVISNKSKRTFCLTVSSYGQRAG